MATETTTIDIPWDTITYGDATLIEAIVARARAFDEVGTETQEWDEEAARMDVTTVHVNDTRLRLRDFLEAPVADFGHDFFGIRRNLNRRTGKLENNFVPRFALR